MTHANQRVGREQAKGCHQWQADERIQGICHKQDPAIRPTQQGGAPGEHTRTEFVLDEPQRPETVSKIAAARTRNALSELKGYRPRDPARQQ